MDTIATWDPAALAAAAVLAEDRETGPHRCPRTDALRSSGSP
ncbi:hypothetical protein OG204_32685 [Streptomyces sp. NBC_01387]|nr:MULTISPECIES: hypothetical protein [unclassified Streptomyces]MCX4553689.1 hypothetical protein [Streptomyces sp. NBC_01500]WSC18617.1 hypothetical protein OIE60_02520 [Streptomyces sp. NBC_01766]WSV52651.1 hypothetical protein OG282_02550 [Streptomyces sp. NBC_01014]